jgi:two-component system sensor histidine kinase HydH
VLQRDRTAARARRGAAPHTTAPLRSAREILAGSVQRLREAARCDLALALARDNAGLPVVAAAAFEGPPPAMPGEGALAAADALEGATDLRADAARELLALVRPRSSGVAVPVRDAAGELLAVLLVASAPARPARPRSLALLDATARRIAAPLAAAGALARLEHSESELRRLDRLAALGALAAEVAHEVRSPLVAVKTFLELLPERRDDPELLEAFLPVARAELARVERLLGLVGEHPRERAQAGSAALAPALEAVGSLLTLLPRGRSVRLETSLAEGLPELAIGPDALRQLLLNLLLNAVEASPEGGRVRIAAQRCADGVELRVEDEGPGVPESQRAHIFEPFHTTRAAGHGGLGLTICRRIAVDAGGGIELLSPQAGGAVFRVVLPAREG